MPPQRDYKIIIFDWDGTIADAEEIILATHLCCIRDLGITPIKSAASIKKQLGYRARKVIENLYPSLSSLALNDYEDMFLQLYKQQSHHINLIGGNNQGHSTLRKLRQHNYRIAIASNKRKELLEYEIDNTQTADYIDDIVFVDDHTGKPEPDMLYAISQATNIPAKKCLMVGDHANDIIAAQRAGMDSAAVLSGSYTPEDFAKLTQAPTIVCNDIHKLAELLPPATAVTP